ELEEVEGFGSVGDCICRTVVTGADGRFTIRALPAGQFRVAVSEEGWDPASRKDVESMPPRPLPGVFTAQKLAIKDGETPAPVVIRGVPHVVVEARISDSKGKKARGHEIDVFGRIDGDSWSARVDHNPDGVYTVLAPHGLENAQINLVTNEHTVL